MYGCVAGQSMSPTSAQFSTIFRFTWHIIVVIHSAPPQADTTSPEGGCAAMTVKQWDEYEGAPKTLGERLEEDAGDDPLA